MTLTVVVLAGVTYGDSLRGTVIESIQTKWIQQLINLMIIAHCFLCFPLMINPVNQEFEELLGISQSEAFLVFKANFNRYVKFFFLFSRIKRKFTILIKSLLDLFVFYTSLISISVFKCF